MSTKLIYIAGPFRAPTPWDIEQNIRRAEALALEAWKLGGVGVICPHANTRFFQHSAPDAYWLDGDLEMVRRCDALLTTDDFVRSSGAKCEVAEALIRNIPVFHTLEDLKQWLSSASNPGKHVAPSNARVVDATAPTSATSSTTSNGASKQASPAPTLGSVPSTSGVDSTSSH